MAIKKERYMKNCFLHLNFNEDDLRMYDAKTGKYAAYATVGRKYIEGYNGTGYAYECNNYQHYICTNDIYMPLSEFSIKMRIKITNTGRGVNFIVASANGYNQVGYPGFNLFYTNNKKFYYQYWDGSVVKTSIYFGSYEVNNWLDLMITKKGKELAFYIDDMINPIFKTVEDVEVYENSYPIVLFSVPQYFKSSAYYAQLHMDEFMLFDKQIVPADIVDERFFLVDGERAIDVITAANVITEASTDNVGYEKLMPRIDDVLNRSDRQLTVDLDKSITKVRKLEKDGTPVGGGMVYKVDIYNALKKFSSPNNFA